MKLQQRLMATLWLGSLGLSPIAAAQNAGRNQVGGRVVSLRDGIPVSHAKIVLRELPSDRIAASTVAAEDGAFHFTGVPAGRYQLTAQAAGYLAGSFLEHDGFFAAVVTGAGLDTGDLTLRLAPECIISGRLTAEAGDPVQQGHVSLYREDPSDAEQPIRRIRDLMVADDGSFEFERLAPGRYFVSASGTPWYAVHPSPEPEGAAAGIRNAVDPALDVVYPVTFYPGAVNTAGAVPIDLQAGDEFTANIQLTPVHGVSLTLQNRPGEAGGMPGLMLMSRTFGDEAAVPIQSTLLNGVRTLSGIPPGEYELREFGAQGRGTARTQAVNVTNGTVSLGPADTPVSTPLTLKLQPLQGVALPDHAQVMLQPSGRGGFFPNATTEHGSAELPDVQPGDYVVQLRSQGTVMSVVAVSVNGRPAAGARLHVPPGEPISAVLTVGGRPVDVKGVAMHDGKPAPGSMVVLVPATGATDGTLFRRDESDLDGRFDLHGVAPGDYILVAIAEGWGLRWNDPATLMRYLVRGVPVSVPPAGDKDVSVAEAVMAQAR